MNFNVKDKIALVTGGASGIGLSIVKVLLNNGIKGVVIADVNSSLGEKIVGELVGKYGQNKVRFCQTDVTDIKSFENAFMKTIEYFNHVDILFNNAGIFDEINWEKSVDVNLKGVINGTLLGIEKYLRNHKSHNEAVIVNTSSVAALAAIFISPIYASTKTAIIGLTRGYGHQMYYEASKVRTIAICPGFTATPITADVRNNLRPEGLEWSKNFLRNFEEQSVDFVAGEVIELVKRAPSGSVWAIENNRPAYEYVLPNKNDFVDNTLPKIE